MRYILPTTSAQLLQECQRLITENRLFRNKVAERSGVGHSTIKRWFRGETEPKFTDLVGFYNTLVCMANPPRDLPPEEAERSMRRNKRLTSSKINT